MSEDEKREVRSNLREQYRAAKDDWAHRKEQARQWADGFEAIAVALRSETPEGMVFIGEADPGAVRSIVHAIPVADFPPKDRLKYSVAKLAAARQRVVELESALRSVGEWPVD